MIPGFSRFAKEYVEERINRWQVKGEFEKSEDYRLRIETEREARIKEYTEEARSKYINDQQPADIKAELILNTYNADAEVYVISHPEFGDFVLPISISEAPDFKKHWSQMEPTGCYVIENDRIALESIIFKPLRGKTKRAYMGTRANAAEYAEAEIHFDFDPIEIEAGNTSDKVSHSTVSSGSFKRAATKADIDLNIPSGVNTSNTNTFAVIIANENYRRVSKVDYAHNDGDIMKRYMVETLGIPEKQVHYIKDATLNDMRGEIRWLSEIGEAFNGEASFILYYAGHGIPDESTADGYLLPVDGYGSLASSGMAMSELNEKVSSIPSKLSLVLLDACFSGAMRDGEMLESARGVAIKVRPGSVNKGNVVVLTASQNDETASKSDEHGHGLFTYYLLKKIQESKGDVRLGDLADYTIDRVRRHSVINSRKPQTPSVLASPMIKNKWSNIVLSKIAK
ncbi:MAG: caspase family protein [Muribaculaceae bacterium]|nr:caspase family protein [Muribaculaceae bacterium]